MTKLTLSLVAVLALGAAACGADIDDSSTDTADATTTTTSSPTSTVTTDEPSTDTDTDTVTVSGELTYRQRIALRPGGIVRVTVEDVSLADAPADIVAETTLALDDGQQVPIPFEIAVDRSEFVDGHRYSVRATIAGPDGDLRWTTDTAHLIDPGQATNSLGQVDLVQVTTADGHDDAGSEPSDPLKGGVWTVVSVDGTPAIDEPQATLRFGDDGTLSGNATCNDFSTSYDLDGDAISLGPVAMTLKACMGEVADQEARILDVIDKLASFEIVDGSTMLVLHATDGATLTARR